MSFTISKKAPSLIFDRVLIRHIKPFIVKSQLFLSVKLISQLKNENFFVENYEDIKTFLKEQHSGLLKSSCFKTPA